MKTFKQLQEDMSKLPKLPGLGGGGGGTDSITGKSSAKSLKKRVIDAGKMATVPARFLLNIKSKPDPTEKFADSRMTPKEKVTSAISDYKRKQKKVNEGVASLAVKSGSKLIPALMTGIGAAGTIMQARRYKTRNNPNVKPKKRKLGNMEKSYHKKELGNRSNDMIVAKPGEADKQNKLIDKYEKIQKDTKSTIEKPQIFTGRTDSTKGAPTPKRTTFKKPTSVKAVNQFEDAAPTNSMGGGAIAGSVEAGDNPPVKKKKRYIYGGTGSRKMWMNNK